VIKGAGGVFFKNFMLGLAKRGSMSLAKKVNPLNWLATVASLLGNPWHTAMHKASMTGILLADLLARTNNPHGFILMGHSLGARVAFYTLRSLSIEWDPAFQANRDPAFQASRYSKSPVKAVYFLGGAVGIGNAKEWKGISTAVEGKLYNCYSKNDYILGFLYRTANFFISRPIGLYEIPTSDPRITNCDVTHLVSGHMEYKPQLERVLHHVHTRGYASKVLQKRDMMFLGN